ncbi:MAG: hypothetical protein JJT81_00730 [Rubellimicrobium sp.]|nr:hypothetical protein [Rubellimicrobium sp.]
MPEAPTRRAALLGCLLALGACGFAPAFGPDGPALGFREQVEVVTADTTVFDYRLREALSRRLGQPASPAYRLFIRSEVDEVSAAITPGGSVTRFNLPGKAEFTLTDSATGAVRAAGTVTSFTGYSATGTTVATRSAADDARDRLAVQLADLIITRLIAATPDMATE